jgi:hypothetical protein
MYEGGFGATNLPFQMHSISDDAPPLPGGEVVRLIAAGTLNVGDAVYLSAAGTVAKAAVAANYQTAMGIVVGGRQTNGGQGDQGIITATGQIGTLAAKVGEYVIVQYSGIAIGVGQAAIAVGAKVTGDATTAGRLSITGATAGQIIGFLVTACGGAGQTCLVWLNHM